jgi:beta-glucanase (GH16 family)
MIEKITSMIKGLPRIQTYVLLAVALFLLCGVLLDLHSPVVSLGDVLEASSSPSASSSTAAVATATSPSDVPAGMTLTFDGEFNTFSRYVDKNGNVTCYPGGTGTWQTVYDFCDRTQPANDEQEVYIDPGFLAYLKQESATTSEADPQNPFSVSGGILSIKAEPSTPQILSAVGSWAKYTSGLITTQFSFSQTYGYFVMRAKLPAGAGLWPAFWLLPEDESWPPEIDAMEAFGATSPQGLGGVTMIHYASHAVSLNNSCGAWYNTGVNITAGFHDYGVDIEPTRITYYFDGKPYAMCPPNPDVNKPMYMLVNLAVGGWPGSPNAQTPWPSYLEVQYVRAYQKTN